MRRRLRSADPDRPTLQRDEAARRRNRGRAALAAVCGAGVCGGLLYAMAGRGGIGAGELFGVMAFVVAYVLASVAAAVGVRRRRLRDWAAAQQQVATARPLPRAALERTILEVAAANDGYVNPGAVALRSGRITMEEARDALEELAAAGLCELETDDSGQALYLFSVEPSPSRDSLSPEEWVERMSGEMDDEGPETTERGVTD